MLKFRAYKLNPYIVEDLVQETLLRAIKSIHQFKEGSNIKAWLNTILLHVFLDYKRKKSREVVDDYLVELATDQKDITPNQYVMIAFTKVKDDVLKRVLIDGFSYEETAREFGIPIGTVMSRVHRGRIKLRKILQGEGNMSRVWVERK